MYEESWKFTVGDDTTRGGFVNKALERGEEYVIFQRALTRDNDVSKCKLIFQSISDHGKLLFESNSNVLLNNENHSASNPTAPNKWDFFMVRFSGKNYKIHLNYIKPAVDCCNANENS